MAWGMSAGTPMKPGNKAVLKPPQSKRCCALPDVLKSREASGLRRVHRRFLGGEDRGRIIRRLLENSRDWICRNKAAAFVSVHRLHWLNLIYLPGGVGDAGGFDGDSICA